MLTTKRSYGWKPSLPKRHFPALELKEFPALAPAFSLMDTGFMPEVWDQGSSSSCTGHGTTAAIMYARAKQKLPFTDLSRLFPYWNARVAEGDTNDDGASVGDVIIASQKYGDCPYADLPTDPNLVTVPPSQQAFTDALDHRALKAVRVLGAVEQSFEYHLKHCISVLQVPVVFGFTVYASFESNAVAQTGMMPMPGPAEQILGGHCVVACGYDDSTKMVMVRNSWGSDWGKGGYFFMPYSFICDHSYASDFHAITLESA